MRGVVISEVVPAARMRQFHEILCAHDGRYLGNPFVWDDKVHVRYAPGDYVAHSRAWQRCTVPIRETRSDQWWRVALRRFGLNFLQRIFS